MPIVCRLGDISETTTPDAHGCPACPHPCKGPAITASANVMIQGREALRVGDRGVHSACCGPNTWEVIEASAQVYVNGMPLVRVGDRTQHCGAIGKMTTGAAMVFDGSPPQLEILNTMSKTMNDTISSILANPAPTAPADVTSAPVTAVAPEVADPVSVAPGFAGDPSVMFEQVTTIEKTIEDASPSIIPNLK